MRGEAARLERCPMSDFRLPRVSPEAEGVRSADLLAFVDALESRTRWPHSVMVVRGGSVLAEGWWEPYRRLGRHLLYSLSKSFTSTAAGLAVAEGKLSLDDPVLRFFPAERPAEVNEHLAAMRVRHLLSMSTGHTEDTLPHFARRPGDNWARTFLAVPVNRPPGTHFLYNSGATYMVSAIVQQVTGQKIVDYLRPRLWDPLGIVPPPWEECPRGINVGGWGLSLRTEDIAKFGQLYHDGGVWRGQRLLPATWVADATSKHISNGNDPNSDWAQGYGFQFWRCRHGAWRGDGAFGQLCLVMPEQETVVALTAGIDDFQGLLNVIWDTLLPALGPRRALPANPADERRLTRRLDALSLGSAPGGESCWPSSAAISRRWYTLEPNDLDLTRVSFDLDTPALLLERQGGSTVRLPFGWQGQWAEGRGIEVFGIYDGVPDEGEPGRSDTGHAIAGVAYGDGRPVSTSGGWRADGTLRLTIVLHRAPAQVHLSAKFTGDELRLERSVSGSFLGGVKEPLIGRLTEG